MVTNDELWKQLENVISLRRSEAQILWAGFGFFWTANAVLLLSLFQKDIMITNHLRLFIPVIGIGMSILSFLTQRRTKMHMETHEKMIQNIQKKLAIDPDFTIYEESKMKKMSGPRSKRLIVFVPFIVFFVAWLFLLADLIGRLFLSNPFLE